jgi:nucleotide-binding universal stress UspA family protein
VIEVIPLTYASELFPNAMTQVVDEITGYAKTEVGRLAEVVRARGGEVHERIATGRAASEIIRVAREDEIDMIVIGTHGRGALTRALFGSTAERVSRRAPCPVFVCHLLEHEFITS